jgi:hypothetical protein
MVLFEFILPRKRAGKKTALDFAKAREEQLFRSISVYTKFGRQQIVDILGLCFLVLFFFSH